ncbi:MAG: hypothetical protein NTV43_05060 [Methylococcales bacterium]|nr:hypothetical protein [Methylococcales bacterium]
MPDQPQTTITGKLALLPNPCTSEPCLPGMAYALDAGNKVYFLTRGERWSDRPIVAEGSVLALDARLTVAGHIAQRWDIRGESFLTLEIASMATEK